LLVESAALLTATSGFNMHDETPTAPFAHFPLFHLTLRADSTIQRMYISFPDAARSSPR
jgi:hypothetical protein